MSVELKASCGRGSPCRWPIDRGQCTVGFGRMLGFWKVRRMSIQSPLQNEQCQPCSIMRKQRLTWTFAVTVRVYIECDRPHFGTTHTYLWGMENNQQRNSSYVDQTYPARADRLQPSKGHIVLAATRLTSTMCLSADALRE
jgi:hypothetical protein